MSQRPGARDAAAGRGGQVVAAIDVGSSAVRLSLAEIDATGKPHTRVQQRLPVRLGRDVFAHGGGGAVGRELQRELLNALGRLVQLSARHRAVRVRAVATSALREARNATAVCAAVQRELGLRLEVLSGAEEATLSREALAAALAAQGCTVAPAQRIYVDLGGGSLELADAAGAFATSLPLGTVRLLALVPGLAATQPVAPGPLAGLLTEVERRLAEALAGHAEALVATASGPWALIGTGGNLEVMAQLAPAPGHGRRVALEALWPLATRVAAIPLAERAARLGLRPDRSDLALPALLVVHALARRLTAQALWVPGSGLRDGLIAALAAELVAAATPHTGGTPRG